MNSVSQRSIREIKVELKRQELVNEVEKPKRYRDKDKREKKWF